MVCINFMTIQLIPYGHRSLWRKFERCENINFNPVKTVLKLC